jgi:hypothetical protein
MADEFDDIGPIDYIVVEFPGNQMTGEGVPILLDLVDKGTIRLLDLMAIVKDADGNVTVAELSQVPELAALARGISGILDDSDVAEVAEILEPNSTAAILVYENTWAAPFAAAVRRGGGQLVASGRIPVSDLIEALDAAEV